MKRSLELLVATLIFSIAFSLAASAQLAHAQEGEVTLYAVDDTWVDSENPDSNHGGEWSLKVSKTQYSPENTAETIVWLKFNLSDVPDGAIIDSAILSLYGSVVTQPHTVSAHSSDDVSWTELTITYSNMPTYNLSSMSSANVTNCCEWYSWFVVDAVMEGLNGIHGGPDAVTIVLLATEFQFLEYASFWSRTMAESGPKLSVHWTEIVPEYSPLVMLALLATATLVIAVGFRRRSPKLS